MERKNLRILHVIPHHDSPSSFIFAKRQVADLDEEGFENKTFFLRSRFSPAGLFSQYRQFKQVIRKFRPDIIHAHYGTITAFFASSFKSIPFVVTFHGSDINMTTDVGRQREKFGKKLSFIAAKRARKIICVSERLQDLLGPYKGKSAVIPSGISTSVFRKMDRAACKQQLGLDPAANYVFFNANNPIVKRLDIASSATALLSDLDVKLLSLDGHVAPDDIPVYLNASVCLLLCSDSEGSPLVVKEAMACDLPVVSVDVGDVKERIAGTENCYIVPQEAGAIAEKIRFLIKSGIESSNGKEMLIKQGLDSSNAARKVGNVYFEALR